MGGSHELFLQFDENVSLPIPIPTESLHTPIKSACHTFFKVTRSRGLVVGQRRGVLSQQEFCDALERVGVTLNDQQASVYL